MSYYNDFIGNNRGRGTSARYRRYYQGNWIIMGIISTHMRSLNDRSCKENSRKNSGRI